MQFQNPPNIQIQYEGTPFFIEENILKKQVLIESWFRKQWLDHTAPIYSSVDLRNSGFKIAPIDTNLFPAGFNNLNPNFFPLAVQALQSTLLQKFPRCSRILLIPENHTRNKFYFESLIRIYDLLQLSGYQTRIGSLISDLKEPMEFNLENNRKIILEPVYREKNKIFLKDFEPCLILLNHDMSDGVPEILKNLEQKILPSLLAGWSIRKKSQHFACYKKVAEEFSALIGMDVWHLHSEFDVCDDVDFLSGQGMEVLKNKVEALLEKINLHYKQLGIHLNPYVVVKADSGTYGMGVMTVKHAKDLEELNRKERVRMAASKGGQKITSVILQEGIYTCETVGEQNAAAEPVLYNIGQHVVGGFYRVHTGRKFDENLNSPGMHFEPLSFCAPCNCPSFTDAPGCEQNRYYAYSVFARLAALAAAKELNEFI